jgi:hypothetical protein
MERDIWRLKIWVDEKKEKSMGGGCEELKTYVMRGM